MADTEYLDFDGEPKKFVDDALALAEGQQVVRNVQYSRDHKNVNGFIDRTKINPDQVHIFVPKLFNIVKIKTSRNINGAIGMRPHIPFDATRPDLRGQSELLARQLDHYLHKAQFDEYYEQSAKLKITYGTSFMECVPYYEQVTEKMMVPHPFTGQPILQEHQVNRLRFRLRTFAPWEVYVDPFARNLTTRTGCRYVIKVELVSKRQIMEMAALGAYPGLDVEKLIESGQGDKSPANHWGLSMLADMGLPLPSTDSDMGVLLRVETPDRFMDLWNGTAILRDIPNPFNHKLINLSIHQHTLDAHTQNAFWGIGECKPNEILSSMLNSSWNHTLNSHEMHNQPTIYYRKGAVNRDSLVRTPGNRVPINQTNDRPISDSIIDAPLHPLPRDAYMIPGAVDAMIDVTSDVYDATRGQESKGQATASEYAMRQAAGDVPLQHEVKRSERFLADFGAKCLSHMEQFGTIEDKIDILGEQGAMELMYSTPNDLPGGWDFTFKGSAKIADQAIQQRNLIQLLPIAQNNPASLPGATLSYAYEKFNVPPSDIQRMVMPDEQLFEMQAQQAEEEHRREMEKAQFDYQSKARLEQQKGEIKKSAEGTNAQQAQGAKKTQVSTRANTAQKNVKV